MHDYNLYKLTVLQKVYVKWERKEKEIVIKILITDNQVTLLLYMTEHCHENYSIT